MELIKDDPNAPALESLKRIKAEIVDKAAPVGQAVTVKEIEAACEIVLGAMGTVDSVWRERITAVREEKGWDATRTLFFLAGKTLNIGNHLEGFSHHYFDSDTDTQTILIGKATCGECGKEFKPRNPGQRYCSNECGDAVAQRDLASWRAQQAAALQKRRIMKDRNGQEAFSVGGPVDESLTPPPGSITRGVNA